MVDFDLVATSICTYLLTNALFIDFCVRFKFENDRFDTEFLKLTVIELKVCSSE